jgi:predicted  nucleic acid-binding Zn-ribbon protein
MTTRREVPFNADSLAWVHNDLADLKSRVSLAQQAAEQSRAVATDAADKAYQARVYMDQFEGHGSAITHLQDDLRSLREQIVRAQDDIHSLRQTREELERRILADSERARQDRNEIARHFSETERQIESWHERFAGVEEMNRRAMESMAPLVGRLEALEAGDAESETLRNRMLTAISRMDQEIQRFSGAIAELVQEDEVHRERSSSAFEAIRRVETDIEGIRSDTNRISRIDDRLELVQAERTRHNERINELSQDMHKVEGILNEFGERTALVEARMSGYQDELRALKERLRDDRERIAYYLTGLNEVLADIKKRQISALEKEIRDIRGRAINFAEE